MQCCDSTVASQNLTLFYSRLSPSRSRFPSSTLALCKNPLSVLKSSPFSPLSKPYKCRHLPFLTTCSSSSFSSSSSPLSASETARIKVIGIGGGGNNAVNRMIGSGLQLETIKKQYKRKSLMVHPDKNKSVVADEALKLISEAWKMLSDVVLTRMDSAP